MIELRPIDPENHKEARRLAVAAHQERFVGSIDRSLAPAFGSPERTFCQVLPPLDDR